MAERVGNALSIGTALENQDLANEQRGLLDLVDKLQYAQLDNIKLPQIVVVGDQSAGKSSVLEAITGTPFPRAAGACTRFATEIRLRRADTRSFSVYIVPDRENRSPEERQRLARFGDDFDESTPFDVIMNLASVQIAPKDVPGRFAAGDLLVVEMKGPSMPLLTLVDLPGLVTNPNNDQSIEDIKAINDLTDRYMVNPRTIILAVVGGNHDYVHAPILKRARHFDSVGSRTIGVLTKPDLTDSIGLEDKFIQLVRNEEKENRFQLGWYVLLNPAPPKDGQPWPSAEERKRNEDNFFASSKWSILPSSVRGVDALKQKLSVQLQRHIGRHVRTLRKEIQKALDDCENELKLLGHGKDTVGEMKDDLFDLFEHSNRLVIPAVDGTYKNPPGTLFFPNECDPRLIPAQNLRARVVDANRQFAKRIRAQGSKYPFSTGVENKSTETTPGTMTKRDFAKRKIEPFLRQRKGTEFQLDHNERLIYQLFQGYATNWPTLAQEHKDNMGIICNEFLGEVIDNLWPQRMREPLRVQFLDPQMKCMLNSAQAELNLVLKDLQFEVQPYDPEYEVRIRTWQRKAGEICYTEAEEFLEKMLIYYELSAKTFITNVITQVIERHLLQGLYCIFSSGKVNKMKNETVEAIAAENKETKDRRIALRDKKIAIEEARDVCLSLANRKELCTYGEEDPDAGERSDEDVSPSPAPQPSPPARRPPIQPPTPASTASSSGPPNSQQQPLQQQPPQPQVSPLVRRPIPATTAGVPTNNPPGLPGDAPAVNHVEPNELEATNYPKSSRDSFNEPPVISPNPSPRLMPRPDNPPQYPPQDSGYGSPAARDASPSPGNPPYGQSLQPYPAQRVEADGQERLGRYSQGGLSPAPGYANGRSVSRERGPGRRFVG
ncbi:hypothetical protein K469DRAFT_716906 [Zopfia rhizophila CBS 207.26]|uniref:P-loop containing nucleoside triphosphate hydrolase protein n=1 Tax=Zopfia rhizophila CBS 207.26 TaxID=1314779 RepID=A0A6A6EMT8_9PEZI|nr:hypothetical protein K469DRAFT_716906 [Zopfia rhizophila CBS 207.26]